jgi:Tetratricopeptide repeat
LEELKSAFACLDDEPDEAHGIAAELLNDDPDNAAALHIVAVIQCRAGRHGMALGMWERLSKLKPGKPEVWNNLGQTYGECQQQAKAREAYRKSLELRDDADLMANMAVSYNEDGQYQEGAKWARKALAKQPGHKNATATLGFSKLALGDWSGWHEYAASIGSKFRQGRDYAPMWDGSEVDSLIVYGEQGLGDEIMYASCLADAQKRAKHVSLECDERLEGLFKRSFPEVDVHGTRRLGKRWKRPFDAQVPCGGLPAFFRPNKEACPAVPYLRADPERRLQWRALFDSYKKPVIGLCWTGGNKYTKRQLRKIGLKDFAPLIESKDAVFVSLQYGDASAEIEASGLRVKQFPWATLTGDYDDTAALVAELSHVVGIHTSVHHLAGALGVSSTILVPSKPMWNYAVGTRLPWYESQVFHRQKEHETWADCIKRVRLDPSVFRV